tara:strand:+ start:4665 stop:4928 length:264 start_codon:yes stop_codon:yes gene_type:complete
LDSLGNLIWVRKISDPFLVEGTAIAFSSEGSVCAAGAFVDSSDFDPDTSRHIEYANGSNDMYILKLDPSRSFTDTLDFSPNTGSRII